MRMFRQRPGHGSQDCIIRSRRGFTLIELAFVLVIIGLLVSFGAQLLPMLTKQTKLRENRTIVKEATTAILGYALASKSLPYADSGTDGIADANTYIGGLPYRTLGIAGSDAYLRSLNYVVDRRLAQSTPAQFETDAYTLANIPSPTPPANPNTLVMCASVKAAFAVYSAGENRTLDSPNNTHANNYFGEPGAPVTGTYDDILDAVSANTLYERLTRLH